MCSLKTFIVQKEYTGCSKKSYEIVSLTNLNEYLHNDTSEMGVNLTISADNSSEKS